MIEQTFATLDLVMPTWTPTNVANADIKTPTEKRIENKKTFKLI